MPLTRIHASLRCDDCAGQCDVGKACPRTTVHTEPGELAPEREVRPPRGTGLLVAVLLVACASCLVLALSLAVTGAPR